MCVIVAFTWGDFLKTECTNNGSYLFCGHGDGGISFLSISCDLVAVCKSYYNSSLKQITAMSWLNGGNSGKFKNNSTILAGKKLEKSEVKVLNKIKQCQ